MFYELTEKQQQGLEICLKRYKNKEPYTIIAGYAGTGKSYLVNAIVDNFGFSEEEVAYACYTGKAALVLQKQGKNAITLHKLLYKSYPNGRGGFINKPKEFLDPRPKLIIVDEISMCPKYLWDLLIKHGVYIIGLGDPFQLPPIGDSINLLDKPHVFLTEVMRQALDNDIVKYSMQLREGKSLPLNLEGEHIRTHSKSELSEGMMKWADQILCGKNITRRNLNNQMREILGKKNVLDNGDKLICTKNYWDTVSNKGDFLINGCIGTVDNIMLVDGDIVHANFNLEEKNYFPSLKMDYKLLRDGEPFVVKDWRGRIKRKDAVELDYGYVITTHKAQGSQFEKVLVYDEHLYNEENHNRWLYTAITRATDKVVVLL